MQSEKIDQIAAALIEVQKEIKPAKKDAENPYFKSHYATLASVWDSCRESLSKHNIAVIQGGKIEGNMPVLTTMLLHSSGQWISGDYPLIAVKQDPQAQGSAMTYARRYCLAAMVGVVTEDDDAEAATDHSAKAAQDAHAEPPKMAGEQRKTSFIPKEIKTFTGTAKASGKPYTSFTIISPDGIAFSTLDTAAAEKARLAIKDGSQVVITYVQNGKFYNLTSLDISLEEAPF